MKQLVAVTYSRNQGSVTVQLDDWLNKKFKEGYKYITHIVERGYLDTTFIFEIDLKDGKGN